MNVENAQDRRAGRVENRRPSDVFLALWRDRTIGAEISVGEFGALADVWQQIRELEICAVSCGRPKPAVADANSGREPCSPRMPPSSLEQGAIENVSESDTEDEPGGPSPATPDDGGELEAHEIDGMEIPAGAKPYKGYLATVKNRTRNRLLEMRARGLTTGQLMAAADGCLGYDDLMSILEARPVRFDVYERLAEVLDEIDGKKAE